MGNYTVGFQGTIEWIEEESYGGGCPSNPTMKSVSDYVQNVKITGDPGRIDIRDYGSADIQEVVEGLNKYGLTVEYMVQNSTLITDCITKTSTGEMQSLYFDLGFNTDGATKSYYQVSGATCKSIEFSIANEEAIKATAEFSVSGVTSTTAACDVGSGSHATATTIGTNVYTFSGCDIERPDGVDLAYIIDSFSATVDNDLDERCSIGSSTIKAALPGPRSVTGNADIAVVDGGKTRWDEVMAVTENDIVWDFGPDSGDPVLTFTNVTWDNIELEGNTDDAILVPSIPWTAQGVTVSGVT